jgi:hypothetical protein
VKSSDETVLDKTKNLNESSDSSIGTSDNSENDIVH